MAADAKVTVGENIMGTLPMGKLITKMSVPVILSMLVSALYSVIDSIFVARMGTDALTAMSLATPISSFIACATVGFSVGMNTVLSRKLGEGDSEAANRAAGNGLLVNWIVAAVFMLFGIFLTGPYYALQTSSASVQALGAQYTSIVCMLSFGVASQVMLERMLVATGRPIGSVWSLTCGTLVNLALDPILIFGLMGAPALGMQGAAIATVIAQFTAAAVALGFNLKANPDLHFGIKMLAPHAETLRVIWNVGAPAAIQQSISPALIFGMNQILLGLSPAAPAVYVIYVRLQSIFLIPVWGLKNTVVSIISYNFGAGKRERIVAAMRICVAITLGVTVAGIAVLQLAPDALLALFAAEGEVLEIGRVALRTVSIAFPFMGLVLILGAFFQALGRSKLTLVASVAELALMMASAFALAQAGDVNAVWMAFIVSELAVAALCGVFMRFVAAKTLAKVGTGMAGEVVFSANAETAAAQEDPTCQNQSKYRIGNRLYKTSISISVSRITSEKAT